MTSNKQLLTASEAAAMLDVDPETVRRWARTGRIPSVRYPSGRRFFELTAIERILRAEVAA